MTKPSSLLQAQTPRLRAAAAAAARSSSSSAKQLDPTRVSGDSKAVAKCLAFDLTPASTSSSGSSKLTTISSSSSLSSLSSQVVAEGLADCDLVEPEFEFSPLPDPAAVFITASNEPVVVPARPSVFSKSGSEDAAAADSTSELVGDALQERLRGVLAEVETVDGLSSGGKRLVRALAEAAIFELNGGAAAFWAKVHVRLVVTMIAIVAAADLALVVAIACRGGEPSYGLPPPT